MCQGAPFLLLRDHQAAKLGALLLHALCFSPSPVGRLDGQEVEPDNIAIRPESGDVVLLAYPVDPGTVTVRFGVIERDRLASQRGVDARPHPRKQLWPDDFRHGAPKELFPRAPIAVTGGLIRPANLQILVDVTNQRGNVIEHYARRRISECPESRPHVGRSVTVAWIRPRPRELGVAAVAAERLRLVARHSIVSAHVRTSQSPNGPT